VAGRTDEQVDSPGQPARPAHDLPRSGNGKGGILNVVNDAGGSSTIANPDVPVTVVNYP
jgi:hypothetical protein